MKTYRGSLLAAAVLLATLPLTSCGDADDYAQTAGIALTSSVASVIVKHEVVFTVTTSFPDPTTTTTTTTPTAAVLPATNVAETRAPVINQCDPTLEYQVSGAGIDRGWTSLPGTTAVRTFILKPREVSPLVVVARGKCIGSMEDWKYSTASNVTVTAPIPEVLPGLPALTLTANPSSSVMGNPITFTLAADKPVNCTVRMKYQYSGAGFGVTTVDPATAGQFILQPTSPGTLTVTATGWCAEKPAGQSTVTTSATVTTAPTITTPTTPTGNINPTNSVAAVYTTSATCSNGDTVEYRFIATGGTPPPGTTGWSTNVNASITWPNSPATPYPGTVSAQARCASSISVISVQSTALNVTVN